MDELDELAQQLRIAVREHAMAELRDVAAQRGAEAGLAGRGKRGSEGGSGVDGFSPPSGSA
jgi:hypothetical protein